MIAGSLVLTDTIDRAFTNIFASSYTNTDLVVTRQAGRRGVAQPARRPCPRRLLPQVQALPGVETASGSLVDISGDGAPSSSTATARLVTAATPTFGFGIDPADSALQPADARRRRWAPGRDEVVIDSQHRRRPRLRGRRHDRRRRRRARCAPYRITGIATLRRRRLARRRDDRRLRHPDRAARCSARPASTRSRSPPRPGVSPAELAPRDRAAAAGDGPGADRRRAGREATRRDLGGDHVHPRLPARVRRHRAVRRRVRHLQHAVDHGRPAHARAGDPAHTRRLAPPGAALGARSRRGDHRPGRPRSSASCSASALAKGLTALFRAARRSTCRRASTVFATRTVVVSLLVGTIVTAARRRRAGDPGDPGAADRGRPRGRDAARGRGSRRPDAIAVVAVGRRRRAARLRPDRRRRSARSAPAAVARRRHARAVHRRGDDLVAPGAAARRASSAGRSAARGAAGALARENAVRNPSRTAVDRRRADDRPRAGHVRRGARRRPDRLRPTTDVDRPGHGRLRRHRRRTAGTRSRRSPAGRAVAAAPGVHRRVERPARPGPRRRRGRRRRRRRPGHHRRGLPLRLDAPARRRRRSARSTTAAPSSTEALRRGPRPGGRARASRSRPRPASAHSLPWWASTTRRSSRPVLGAALDLAGRLRRRPSRGRRTRTRSSAAPPGDVAGIERAWPPSRTPKVATTAELRGRPTWPTSSTILNMLYVLLALSVVVSLFGMVNTLVLVGARAHPRARDAAGGRDDPPAGAADGARRERRHRADRRGARRSRSGSALAALAVRAMSEWGVGLVDPGGRRS